MYLVRIGIVNNVFRRKNMLTRKQLIVVVCLAITVTLVSGLVSLAAEGPEPNVVTLQGFVSTSADANNVIKSVRLTTDENIIYEVALDEKGIELGKKMDGKQVEVTGIVTEKDEQKWIEVQSFKALDE
jgi:hypothetical protein